jgi:YD repeat-containing protein
VYEYGYNDNNYLIIEKYPLGNGYAYSYDENNNVVEKRFQINVSGVPNPGDIVTKMTYDLTFNKPTQVIQPNGLVLDYVLDENGNVISKTTTGADISYIETYEYDVQGQLVAMTDPNENRTEMIYEYGNIIELTKKGDSEDIVTVFAYDAQGNLTKITDPRGKETTMNYDDFNLISQITSPE